MQLIINHLALTTRILQKPSEINLASINVLVACEYKQRVKVSTTYHSYRIAPNYSPGVYFFPAIFNQATKRYKYLLVEDSHAVYNL